MYLDFIEFDSLVVVHVFMHVLTCYCTIVVQFCVIVCAIIYASAACSCTLNSVYIHA